MHHRTVEQLAAGAGPIHRLDPRVKLVTVLAFVVGVSTLPVVPLTLFLWPAVLVLSALLVAGLPFLFVLSRSLLVLPFVLMVAMFLPFTRGPTPLWVLPGLELTVYQEGLQLSLAILIKGALALLAVEWLVFTTPFHRLLLAMRAFRVPRVIVVTLSFLFRYLDLLADQSQRVRRARMARAPGGTVRWRLRSTGGMIGRLLLRALDRADRVHQAMLARGFDGEIRILSCLQMRRVDVVFLVGAGAGLVAVPILGLVAGGGL